MTDYVGWSSWPPFEPETVSEFRERIKREIAVLPPASGWDFYTQQYEVNGRIRETKLAIPLRGAMACNGA